MLNIICALKHEARPLVDHFELVPHGPGHPFVTYQDMDKTMSLTITGIGNDAAAAGTSYAVERFHTGHSDVWLNIGIAGHKDLTIGTPVLAGTISDSTSGQVWHPSVNFIAGLAVLPLVTVDQVPEHYPDNVMIDMEAAGFFISANKVSSWERIHCLKIISDNLLSPPHNISKQTVVNLVSGNIKVIDAMVANLYPLTGKPATATL